MSKWGDIGAAEHPLVKIRCAHDHGTGQSFLVGLVLEIHGMAFLNLRGARPVASLPTAFNEDGTPRRVSLDWQISERLWTHLAAGGRTIEADGSTTISDDPLYSPWCPTHHELELTDWSLFFDALTSAVALARRGRKPATLVVPLP